VEEENRLGGLVLHSSLDSTKKRGNRLLFAPAGFIAKHSIGAYDTEANLQRLAQHDPYIPLHLRSGVGDDDSGDDLSLSITHLDGSVIKDFKNKNTFGDGTWPHQYYGKAAANFDDNLGNITQMVTQGRSSFGDI
jgi:hypothetical protein